MATKKMSKTRIPFNNKNTGAGGSITPRTSAVVTKTNRTTGAKTTTNKTLTPVSRSQYNSKNKLIEGASRLKRK